MKFYLIQISEGDSKVVGKTISEYATLEEATANYHKKLGTAMGSELYTSVLMMLVNSEGGIHKNEKYVAVAENTAETE